MPGPTQWQPNPPFVRRSNGAGASLWGMVSTSGKRERRRNSRFIFGCPTRAVRAADSRYCWLVDPNDGTSAYLKGWRGSAVSIAALRDGVPVLGVVYAFGYPDDAGDLIAWAEGCPLTRNGHAIDVQLGKSKFDAVSNPVVFISQDADKNPQANTQCVQPARYIALPSIAYRLARVAAGDGVAAVSLNSPVGWDYAAGHALVRGAGGVMIDEKGREISYSLDGQSAVRWCFGGSHVATQSLCKRDWKKVFSRVPSLPSPFL